jgi:hypothetical protein
MLQSYNQGDLVVAVLVVSPYAVCFSCRWPLLPVVLVSTRHAVDFSCRLRCNCLAAAPEPSESIAVDGTVEESSNVVRRDLLAAPGKRVPAG